MHVLRCVLALGAHCIVCYGLLNTAHWSHGLGLGSHWLLLCRNVFLFLELEFKRPEDREPLGKSAAIPLLGGITQLIAWIVCRYSEYCGDR